MLWSKHEGILDAVGGSQALFTTLFGPGKDTFWLDTSTTDRGRFSYMGGRGGPLWKRITYKLPPPTEAPHQNKSNEHAAVRPAGDQCPSSGGASNSGHAADTGTDSCEDSTSQPSPCAGQFQIEHVDGTCTSSQQAFFEYLDAQLQRQKLRISSDAASQLPFNFWGGFVGYLGYELKAECGGKNTHASGMPDTALFFCDRLLAVDHLLKDVYVLAAYDCSTEAASSSKENAQAWVDHISSRIAPMSASTTAPVQSNGNAARPEAVTNGNSISEPNSAPHAEVAGSSSSPAHASEHKQAAQPVPSFSLRHPEHAYLRNIEACKQALYDGDSYEICLTTRMSRSHAPDPWRLYRTLRALNPAPYAAWLSFGGAAGFTVCCSSPERFLRRDRGGLLEARPIKGTAPRSKDPEADKRSAHALATSEKDRAENLMIVDLLRNDLGRVSAGCNWLCNC